MGGGDRGELRNAGLSTQLQPALIRREHGLGVAGSSDFFPKAVWHPNFYVNYSTS